jgi:hypothetical protein
LTDAEKSRGWPRKGPAAFVLLGTLVVPKPLFR